MSQQDKTYVQAAVDSVAGATQSVVDSVKEMTGTAPPKKDAGDHAREAADSAQAAAKTKGDDIKVCFLGRVACCFSDAEHLFFMHASNKQIRASFRKFCKVAVLLTLSRIVSWGCLKQSELSCTVHVQKSAEDMKSQTSAKASELSVRHHCNPKAGCKSRPDLCD